MLTLLLACAAGTDTATTTTATTVTEITGPSARMDFIADDDLYAAPFPGDHRLTGGVVDLSAFPDPGDASIVTQTLSLLEGVTGFSTTGAIFFSLEAPLDPASLPEVAATVEAGASVVLIDVTPGSAAQRIPVELDFAEDGGPFGAENMLTLLPVQGVPLRPDSVYAAALTTGLILADGAHLGEAAAVTALRAGEIPDGLDDPGPWIDALAALDAAGVADVAALTVFTTDDPAAPMRALAADIAGYPLELAAAPALTETLTDTCVYESTVTVPVYQQGEAPYLASGGGIIFEDGAPVLDHTEEARVIFSIPRQQMPDGGWPVAVMIRTGGGGDRPLVDRGVHDETGTNADPDSALARTFAQAGYAGFSIDGPLGGIRNPTGGDEQFLIFNIANPEALRDNLRQSAAELTLLPAFLSGLTLDVPDCPGAAEHGGAVTLTTEPLLLVGHSMGATIAPATLGVIDGFDGVVLSGAGGSWIENIVYKQSPLEVRPIAEQMLGYDSGELDVFDPFLTLLQWGGEGADPPVFAEDIRASSRSVLMIQGIVDTYILPPIANATSLSMALDLGGEALDENHTDLTEFAPFCERAPLVGSDCVDLPISGNRDGATRVVVQHAEDGIEDGHEVMFQLEAARTQIVGFAEGLKTGTPVVE